MAISIDQLNKSDQKQGYPQIEPFTPPLSRERSFRRYSDISPSQPPVWTGTPPIIWGNGLNVRPQAALTPTNIYSQVTNIYSQIHEYLLTNSRIFTHKFTNIYSPKCAISI